MILDISGVLSGKSAEEIHEFSYEIPEEYFQELGVTKMEPVSVTARVSSFEKDELSIDVSYRASYVTECSRCHKPVEKSIEKSLEKVIYLKKSGGEFEDDRVFIKGMNLNVGLIVAEDILLNMPISTICDESCRGLCSVCGCDLNVTQCDCHGEVIDPRLESLKNFFK
jgi:uncharacterized protein